MDLFPVQNRVNLLRRENTRKEQVAKTRLRIGLRKFNRTLHIVEKHPTGSECVFLVCKQYSEERKRMK